jgi:hypothetical protein
MMADSKGRKYVLWAILNKENQLVGIRALIGERHICMVLFETQALAEAWILAMRLESHTALGPLNGKTLVEFLDKAREAGWGYVTKNPPPGVNIYFQYAPIEQLQLQAKALFDEVIESGLSPDSMKEGRI